jgi:hypothetical protein
MTGSRPNRRPRKRPKNVQKQMDVWFIHSLTTLSYSYWWLWINDYDYEMRIMKIICLFFYFQNVFPGLWLVGITADAYRVADTPTKVLSLYFLCVVLILISIILCFYWLFDYCRGREAVKWIGACKWGNGIEV